MGAGPVPEHIRRKFLESGPRKYKVKVYTASSDYHGDDRIDVSAQSGHFIFAPPKTLAFDFRLGKMSKSQFRKAYYAWLEESCTNDMHSWNTILDRERIVLVCTCKTKDKSCHRYFLADFLKGLGAVYKGEIRT
jgi:uncharacterized protein YeaO (DUF488 family)